MALRKGGTTRAYGRHVQFDRELRGQVARLMLAQDARWISDALLSSRKHPSASGVLPLLLLGHASRIVYEGAVLLRAADNFVGIPALAHLLPEDHADVIARARHAAKLIDDTQVSFEDLLRQLTRFYEIHHDRFSGNALWFARRFETDLGTFEASGRVIASTIPVQFRLGIAPSVSFDELGPAIYDVAVDLGGALAVLAASSGDGTPTLATIDFAGLGTVRSKDRKTDRYLAGRFDSKIPFPAKLLILMLDGELQAMESVFPWTEGLYAESVFRARYVTLFHAARTLEAVLSAYPLAQSAGSRRLRDVLDEPSAQQFLRGDGSRRLRNRCMHYEIRDRDLQLRADLPMSGLVEFLIPDKGYEEVDISTKALGSRLATIVAEW